MEPTLDALHERETVRNGAALVAGLLVGAGAAVVYDGPYELLPVAVALAVAVGAAELADGEWR